MHNNQRNVSLYGVHQILKYIYTFFLLLIRLRNEMCGGRLDTLPYRQDTGMCSLYIFIDERTNELVSRDKCISPPWVWVARRI
jgi:hypothetical protein